MLHRPGCGGSHLTKLRMFFIQFFVCSLKLSDFLVCLFFFGGPGGSAGCMAAEFPGRLEAACGVQRGGCIPAACQGFRVEIFSGRTPGKNTTRPLTGLISHILFLGKGVQRPFPCFRRGRVRAEPEIRVKGLVPCGFLRQRLKPPEGLASGLSKNRGIP